MDEVYLGTICFFAFNWAPVGFAKCNGTLLPVSQNQALFSLIGYTYGGSGANFALPNLSSSLPNSNMIYCIATEGIYPTRP